MIFPSALLHLYEHLHEHLHIPFQKILHQDVGEEATPFPVLPHFTLDIHLIMLRVKQGGIKHHFLSFCYDLTWDWTPVYQAIGGHTHIFFFIIQRVKACAILCPHQLPTRSDNTVWRYPWCNGYRRRKWTQQYEFKSWTRPIAFHIALIPLGKVWIQLFSLQLWVNSRADWFP